MSTYSITGNIVNKVEIYLEPMVIAMLKTYAKQKNEAGGVLLGHRYIDNLNIKFEIMQFTTPYSGDICTANSYHRKDKRHSMEVSKFHSDTNGYGDFIGEWHTHPNGSSTAPSYQDFKAFSFAQKLSALPLVHIISNSHQIAIYNSRGKHVVTYL